ncbi:hypothetical protein [Lysinibacillus irui]|uniref:hypothetical protein n=1 Tax=Lysinibacillus irui TaxID=2998077 RepID=UPI002AD271DB|nr:hypothetical protein [Lysinibacillus irui]MEA0562400.1 hypothetical protein [Lysinibacillus irui]
MKKSYIWGVLFVAVVLSIGVAFFRINDKETESIVEDDGEESLKETDLSWVDVFMPLCLMIGKVEIKRLMNV